MTQVIVFLLQARHPLLSLLELADWGEFAYNALDLHSVSVLLGIEEATFVCPQLILHVLPHHPFPLSFGLATFLFLLDYTICLCPFISNLPLIAQLYRFSSLIT